MSLFDECGSWLVETMYWDEENIRWPGRIERKINVREIFRLVF